MYNNEDWRQFYRLNKDGLGGAGGYTYGVDGLGYGCTPGINQYETKGDWYAIAIINDGQGTNGYTVNNGNNGTPDKYLHVGELESSHYHWNHSVGQGGYGGVTWDNRGGSTPVMNYHSVNIDHRSVANILDNGNAYASQIETNYNHGATPPAFGWMYQGSPAGFGHIAIVFSWGESSASSQSVAHQNGANSRSCSQIQWYVSCRGIS